MGYDSGLWKSPEWRRWIWLDGGCSLRRALAGAGLRAADHRTNVEAVLEELLSVKSPHRISLGGMASSRRDPMLELGKRVKMEEWQMKCYGLTTTPILHPPAPVRGRMQKRVDGRRSLTFSFSLQLVIGDKLC